MCSSCFVQALCGWRLPDTSLSVYLLLPEPTCISTDRDTHKTGLSHGSLTISSAGAVWMLWMRGKKKKKSYYRLAVNSKIWWTPRTGSAGFSFTVSTLLCAQIRSQTSCLIGRVLRADSEVGIVTRHNKDIFWWFGDSIWIPRSHLTLCLLVEPANLLSYHLPACLRARPLPASFSRNLSPCPARNRSCGTHSPFKSVSPLSAGAVTIIPVPTNRCVMFPVIDGRIYQRLFPSTATAATFHSKHTDSSTHVVKDCSSWF